MHTYTRQREDYVVFFDPGGNREYFPIRTFKDELHAIVFVSYLNGGSGSLSGAIYRALEKSGARGPIGPLGPIGPGPDTSYPISG